MEKPRVTEIKVRMDCNGCVQKIKKSLLGINGVYELYIDFPQQKITIFGCAEPDKIAKAIKKTRKTAIICSHTESPGSQAQPPDSAAQGEGPAQDSANPPPSDPVSPRPTEDSPGEGGAPPAESPKDPPPTPPENPKPETKPSQDAAEASLVKAVQPPGPKDVEEVHVIYHHHPDYGYNPSIGQGYNGQWSSSPGFRPEPSQPIYVTHSYNTYRASPYVTGYEYIRPPPPPQYIHSARPLPEYTHYSRPPPPPQYTHYNYIRPEGYSEDYHYGNSYGNNGNGNINSVFSDENPNACRIV